MEDNILSAKKELEIGSRGLAIKTIFNHYGYDEQLKQLSEETGELFKALNKYRRKKHYPHME